MRILKRTKRRTRKPVFLSSKLRKRKKVWRGIFWFALLSLAALPSIHWANRLLYQKQLQTVEPFLQPLPLWDKGQGTWDTGGKLWERVVIVSPHPDDETLGCAGLIQSLLRHGLMPFVLVFTNGDGFDASIHLKLYEVKIKPEDREAYSQMRMAETLKAMAKLGLPSHQVIFLGFSERTLPEDWLWKGDEKFVKVLAEHLERIQPTVVILPSRYDDHPIHAIVCSIGWTALLQLISEERLSQMPRVFEVLIHYGEFPRPQGFNPSLELLPPSDLLLTARWYYLSLSKEMRQRKWQALNCYHTQKLPLTWRFLKSFVRSNEIFAEPLPLTTQPDRTGEPRSLLSGLDIAQVRVEPMKMLPLVPTSQTHQKRVFVQLRGNSNSHLRYGIRIAHSTSPTSVLLTPLRRGKTLVVDLPVPINPPAVIVAFTGYGRHILDVAPLVLTEGVENERR
ncbi:PIG-L family deacetylase [Fervidibacter sacchari]|uniref:LmbE family N-acetylglucosaminyl deacetylase n=1 Tax=Candidatus Fervidibacter sacchari TaxID=1448929 RepID=A0ABT2EI69_9BACT|nr:PIG-L family deacetylase [Candidatus Fervidibacter sacchari]MCS3917643.1 LmbE family N-acetylglucosaminyl deacetylase [Candidatus Fervidibacter sacchari]WKU15475.1 PIG-L family deacetylase [Candidatus Fervidibacter sacchari]